MRMKLNLQLASSEGWKETKAEAEPSRGGIVTPRRGDEVFGSKSLFALR